MLNFEYNNCITVSSMFDEILNLEIIFSSVSEEMQMHQPSIYRRLSLWQIVHFPNRIPLRHRLHHRNPITGLRFETGLPEGNFRVWIQWNTGPGKGIIYWFSARLGVNTCYACSIKLAESFHVEFNMDVYPMLWATHSTNRRIEFFF